MSSKNLSLYMIFIVFQFKIFAGIVEIILELNYIDFLPYKYDFRKLDNT